jgi:hypothetical protein
MKLKILAICLLAVFLSVGCQTTGTVQQPPPAGCDGSWLYANQTTTNLLLSVAVTGLHVMSAEKPAYYTLAHAAAKEAAALLRKQPVTLSAFSNNPYLVIFAPLSGLIPVDRVLCPWEREYLASFLDMV